METGGLDTLNRRRRAPLVVAAVIPLVELLALPFAGQAGPEMPGFTSAWCAVVLSCDVLTAILLWGLHRNSGDLRLLVLSVAYLWSAAMVFVMCFAMPGAISADPTFGTLGGSPGWLWVSRHVGPPVLIALGLAPWPRSWQERQDRSAHPVRRAVVFATAVLALGPGSLTALMIWSPDTLPAIYDPVTLRFDALVLTLVLVATVTSVAVATAGVALRGAKSGLEVWAIVAVVAWLGDVAFTAMYEDRFTVAFYGARFLGIAASLIVPASILNEVWAAHRRLMAGAHDLEEQVTSLLEAARLRDHVAAVVSHDMRSPLAGLQGYLELLEDSDNNAIDPALAKRMHQRSMLLTRRITLLTEDLLAATTMEHSDLVIVPELVDLAQQLNECASGFPDLDLRMVCRPGLVAWADPLRLQQVLANLVSNAEKHGAEPVTIEAASDGREVMIRVTDAGEGVPETFIPRLFERYSQGPQTGPGGSGLGLSVVRDLVRAHNGTVRYDLTAPAFIVTLPAMVPTEPTPDSRVLSPPRRSRSGHRREATAQVSEAADGLSSSHPA